MCAILTSIPLLHCMMAISLLVKICLLVSGFASSTQQELLHLDQKEDDSNTLQCALTQPSSFSEEIPECTLPWSYCDNGTCKCANSIDNIIQCHHHGHDKKSLVLHTYCVTYDEVTAATEVGYCIFSNGVIGGTTPLLYVTLPSNVTELNEFLCGPFNRTGTLCGRCKDDHYPLAYSVDMTCVQCPNGRSNWWKFVLAAFLPLTLFYFIVLLFRVNVTSSHLHGFVYCSQGIAIPSLIRISLLFIRNKKTLEPILRVFGSFYGIWNLDFLRYIDLGICLQTDTLTTVSLEVAVGVYPLLLMLVTYILIELYDRNFRPLVIMWRPFGAVFSLFAKNWDTRTSLIDAFMTFMFLSTFKFMTLCFDLLAPVHVKELDSLGNTSQSWRLYYDATVPYFGERHLPYAILAIAVLLIFSVLPAMILLLYPFAWFQKCLNLFPVRWYILHTFMDSFQGCYKDGTQPGTRDCRWFASVFFISRHLVLLVGILIPTSTFVLFAAMLITLVSILLITVQPFKTSVSHYATVNALFIFLLALWYIVLLGISNSASKNLQKVFVIVGLSVISLPLLYMTAIIVHWLYSHRKFGLDLIRTLRAWRHGYQTLQHQPHRPGL